jgi:hypothetical protein
MRDLGMLGQWWGRTGRGTVFDRMARIKREGSPVYVWQPAAIAAGATAAIETRNQFPASRKYEPLDSIEIVNNEVANDLMVTINGGDQRFVPAGTIRHIHGRGVALWHLAITNQGGAITTAGSIVVSMQREPYTIDRWAGDQ